MMIIDFCRVPRTMRECLDEGFTSHQVYNAVRKNQLSNVNRKDSKAYEEKIALVGTYVEGIGENFEIPGFYEQSLAQKADDEIKRNAKEIHDSFKGITAAGDVTITAGDKSATLKKEDFHQTDDEVFS